MALSEAPHLALAFKKCFIQNASFMKSAPALLADFCRDNTRSSAFFPPPNNCMERNAVKLQFITVITL